MAGNNRRVTGWAQLVTSDTWTAQQDWALYIYCVMVMCLAGCIFVFNKGTAQHSHRNILSSNVKPKLE